MATRKKPKWEVLSPDADGWNELIDDHVSTRNKENQLVMIIITPLRTSVDDVQAYIDHRMTQDVECSIERIKKTGYRNIKFNKAKLYFVVDLCTYNPFTDASDCYDLTE